MNTSCSAHLAIMAFAVGGAYIGHDTTGMGGDDAMHSTPAEDQRGRTEGLLDNWLDTQLMAACQTDAPILLIGAVEAAESVAREIHESSGWGDGPFVVIDCSTSDVDVLLSRLSPEDASPNQFDGPGLRRSQDGVLFFREVGHLSPSARGKLAQWLAQLRRSGKPGPSRRVMASNADPLALDALFDDPLYPVDVIRIQVEVRQDGN